MDNTPRRAGIYCRLSTAPDGSTEKVERQESVCRELAQRLGWPVVDVYADNSRSAWSRNRKRPEWDRMRGDVERQEVDGLIVYHGDRLIRQPWDLEVLLKLADDKHLPLASPGGTRDLNNADDRFILRIEAAQACRESDNTSRRQKSNNVTKAEKGLTTQGGPRPFGFGVDTGRVGVQGKPVFDFHRQRPDEAKILREAAERVLDGHSVGSIVAWMNQVSTTTVGGRWTYRALTRLLRSPRVAGLIERRERTYAAAWKPIIEPETWRLVVAALDEIRANKSAPGAGSRERAHLLSGIALCGSCERPLYTRPRPDYGRTDRRVYYCRNADCPQRTSRDEQNLDAYIVGRALRLLNDKAYVAALHADTDAPELAREIAEVERRRKQTQATIENLADHPDVDIAFLGKSLASFDRKLAELRDKRAASTDQRRILRAAGMSREQWDILPIDVQAETIRAMFVIRVFPGKKGPGFDPEFVKVKRRT